MEILLTNDDDLAAALRGVKAHDSIIRAVANCLAATNERFDFNAFCRAAIHPDREWSARAIRALYSPMEPREGEDG